MRGVARTRSARTLRRVALAAGAIACLAHTACQDGDPFEEIRRQQATGDFEGSLEPLRERLRAQPDDAEAHYLYGRALVLTQQGHLAGWSLQRAMDDPDWLIPAGLQLASLRLTGQDFNEVEEITGRILERDPDNVSALLMRAQAYVHWKKKPEQALADADRVLELAPDVVGAYEPRMLALLALDRKEEAREVLAEAGRRLTELGADPSVLAWHCAATAASQRDAGDVEGAREKWAECLDAHPVNLQVVSGVMSFHDTQGEFERSLEVAEAAYRQAPDAQPLRTALVNRLALMGRAAEAEALLREAAEADQSWVAAVAWEDLARLRQRLGDAGAAAEAFEHALELARLAGPAPPELEFDYADTLVVAGQLGRALEVAEGLSVPAHRHLIRARVAQQRHQPTEALAEFDAGLRLWPDNPYARYYAAVAAEELGDFDRAVAEYRYAVRNSPAATDARTRGATLMLAEGNPRGALDFLIAGTGRGDGLEIEGQMLSVRAQGALGNRAGVKTAVERIGEGSPNWVGRAWAEAAEGLALRVGPGAAAELLATVPKSAYAQLRYAPALRAFVRYAHEAGETAVAQAALRAALATHPESGALQEIRGLDLELSGAPGDAVRSAFQRAVDLEPGNALALAGLGRLALVEDSAAALDLFDRAAAADPTDPAPKLEAARILIANRRLDEAAERLDALLLAHPYQAEAAKERARIDLERGTATPRTLERAQRAVRFRGGPDALDLLSQVHERLGDPEAAARAAERARALRDSETEVEG